MTTDQVSSSADLERIVAEAESKFDPSTAGDTLTVEPVIPDEPAVNGSEDYQPRLIDAPEAVQPPASPAPVPQPPPPPASQQLQQMRQQLAQAEQRSQAAQQKLAADQMHNEVVAESEKYYSQLVNQQGLPEETARQIATDRYNMLQGQLQAEQQGHTMQAESNAKIQVARSIGKKYGIDPFSLMNYSRPEDMIREASRNQELNGFRARVEALEKGRVPAQSMDSNRGATAASDTEFLKLYESGMSNDHERANKVLSRLSDRPILG
tara:strand:- start:39 stop:836 length:798 start_codon:yes stop_codon:yes gene_type:complete